MISETIEAMASGII